MKHLIYFIFAFSALAAHGKNLIICGSEDSESRIEIELSHKLEDGKRLDRLTDNTGNVFLLETKGDERLEWVIFEDKKYRLEINAKRQDVTFIRKGKIVSRETISCHGIEEALLEEALVDVKKLELHKLKEINISNIDRKAPPKSYNDVERSPEADNGASRSR